MRMPGYSAEQIRATERPLLEAGVPLMQRASEALAAEVARPGVQRVLLLVGSGDNGGDALFAGATLAGDGVDVAIVGDPERMHAPALTEALRRGAHVEPLARLVSLATAADTVVDGLVGIGSGGALRGLPLEIVTALLPLALPRVVAVDIPSGIGPDDGSVPGVALPAETTITFGAVKAGLLVEPAASLVGRVLLVDIGLDLTGVTPVVPVASGGGSEIAESPAPSCRVAPLSGGSEFLGL